MRPIAGLKLLAVAAAFCGWAAASSAADSNIQLVPDIGRPDTSGTVALSGDGRYLAYGGGTTSLWDVETGRMVRTFDGDTESPLALALNADGSALAVAGHGEVERFDTRTGKMTGRFTIGGILPSFIAMSSDGSFIAVPADPDEEDVLVWSDRSQRVRKVPIDIGTDAIKFDEENGLLVIIDVGGSRVYDIDSLLPVKSWRAPPTLAIDHAAFVPGTSRVVIGANDISGDSEAEQISTVDYRYGETVAKFTSTTDSVEDLAVTGDGNRVFASIGQGQVQAWNIGGGDPLGTVRLNAGRPLPLPGGTAVIAPVHGGFVVVNLATGIFERHFGISDQAPIQSVSNDGRLGVLSLSGWSALVDLQTNKILRQYAGDAYGISGDGATLWGTPPNDDRTLVLWGAGSSDPIATIPIGSSFDYVHLSEDGKVAVIGMGRAERVAREAENWSPTPVPGISAAADVALSPDGQTLAEITQDGAVNLLALPSGRILQRFRGLSVGGNIAVSPDGREVLAASLEDLMLLWDAKTGKILHTFKGAFYCVGFSPDGKLMYACDDAGVVVLDSRGTKTLGEYDASTSARDAAFSADYSRVTVAYDDGSARIWDMKTRRWLVLDATFRNGDSLALTPEGFFAGVNAARHLHFATGLDALALGPASTQALLRPDVVAAKLTGGPEAAAATPVDLAALVAADKSGSAPAGAAAAPAAVPQLPTHVVIAGAPIRDKPGTGGAAQGELSPGTQVALMQTEGDWALIARNGKQLGYVPVASLAPLH